MSDPDFDKIAPADLSLSVSAGQDASRNSKAETPVLGAAAAQEQARYQKQGTRLLWGIFSLLLLLAGGVIFLLPRFISPPQSSAPITQVATSAPSQGQGGAAAAAISPFQEAQRLRQREQAQEVLGEVLDLQQTLEQRSVSEWDGEAFEQALAMARQGDEAYREQRFQEATASYQAGLDQLMALEASIPERFQEIMAQATEAFDAGQAEQAERLFSIAILMRPDSDEAITGLDRSQVLSRVLDLVAEGEALHQQGELEEARDLYRAARDIDEAHPAVRSALTRVNQDILDRDFAQLMSRGYLALQGGDPEGSQEFFRQAQSLKPDSQEAEAALKQAADTITTAIITRHLQAAADHESREAWQSALDAYHAALEVDPNLVQAIEGRDHSDFRLRLDNYLAFTVDNPLRLAEEEIYQQASQVYREALNIQDPGPRLSAQLEGVGYYLDKARQPIPVTIRSDGETQVTLLRIRELGKLTSTTLELPPGSYTAIGVRPGYRDVREEFVVSFSDETKEIMVSSQEAIR